MATKTTDKDRGPARIDEELLKKARFVATVENRGVSEVLERELRNGINRRYAQAKARVADLGGGES
jgi:hypothetical protein